MISIPEFPFGRHAHQTLSQVQNVGQGLAPLLKPGIPLGLSGPLGVGKTALARCIIQSLCSNVTHVPSPTFPLMVRYETSAGFLWHMDLFRIQEASKDALESLGIEELVTQNICLIEWPFYLKNAYLGPYWTCEMEFDTDPQKRTVWIKTWDPIPTPPF